MDEILRKPLGLFRGIFSEKEYSNLLTHYAYESIREQATKSSTVQFSHINNDEAECIENSAIIRTTENSCNCCYFLSKDLPCTHLFAFWVLNEKNTFRPTLCNKRWLLENNKFSGGYNYIVNEPTTSQVEVEVRVREREPQRMSQIAKYRKADAKLKKICQIVSEKSQNKFDQYMETIDKLLEFVQNDQVPGRKTWPFSDGKMNYFIETFFSFQQFQLETLEMGIIRQAHHIEIHKLL